jgi:hypothetical protein
VLGIVGLLGAVGLWMLKKWGLWITIIVNVLGALSAAPGIAFAPNVGLQAAATIGTVVSALIIVLVVLPISRNALTAA